MGKHSILDHPYSQKNALQTRRYFIIVIIIILFSMSFSIYAATLDEGPLMQQFFNRDDAFYYFKVAQNISEGYGITFDRIAPTNGFHPLWLVICIPLFSLARFNLILPFRLLLVLLGLLNVGTIWFVFCSLRQTISERAGIVGACIWAFSCSIQMLVSRMGLETGLTAFCISFLVYMTIKAEKAEKWEFKYYFGSSLAAVLVLLSRLDSIFLVIFIGIWLMFRKTRLQYLLMIDMVASALAVTLSFYLRLSLVGDGAYTMAFRPATFIMTLLAVTIHPLVYLFFGLYRHSADPRKKPFHNLIRLSLSTMAGSILIATAMYILLSIGYFQTFPRTIPFFECGISLLFILAGRRVLQLISPEITNHEGHRSLPFWLTRGVQGLTYFGLPCIILAVYMLGNKLYAGTITPVSGQIKHWWAILTYTIYGSTPSTLSAFLDQFLDIWTPLSQFIHHPIKERLTDTGISVSITIALFILISFLVVTVASKNRNTSTMNTTGFLVPLLAGSLTQFIFYDVYGYVSSKEWYWVSQMLFLVFLFAIISELFINMKSKGFMHVVVRASIDVACGILFINFAWTFASNTFYSTTSINPYQEEATFIENMTEPGTLVGLTGGGTVAYFIQDRTVINLDGLINSTEYFTALKENRVTTYLDGIGLDYVYGNVFMLTESIPYGEIFRERIKAINQTSSGTLFHYYPAMP
jgi:hypothetical protein